MRNRALAVADEIDIGGVLDSYEHDVTSMPEYLEKVEDRFGFVTMDLEEAQATLRRANLRLRVGQRRGSRRSPVPGGDGFPGSGS